MPTNSADYESILSSSSKETPHQVVIPCSILKKRNNDDDRSSTTCSMSRSSSESSSRSERSQDERIPQHEHHYDMHRVSFALKEDVKRGLDALNDVLCRDDIGDCTADTNALQEEDPEISTFETVIKDYERDMQKLEEVNVSLTEKVAQLMVDKAQREEEDIYVDMVLNEEKLQKTIRKLTRKLKIERQLVSQLAENLKAAADKIKDTENERDAWKEKYEHSMSMRIY